MAKRYPIVLTLFGVNINCNIDPEPLFTYQYNFVPSNIIVYIFDSLWDPSIDPDPVPPLVGGFSLNEKTLHLELGPRLI